MGVQQRQRPPGDRLLDLVTAGPIVEHTGEWLRRMWWRSDPPPLWKNRRGKWRVWESELVAWHEARLARQALDDVEPADDFEPADDEAAS